MTDDLLKATQEIDRGLHDAMLNHISVMSELFRVHRRGSKNQTNFPNEAPVTLPSVPRCTDSCFGIAEPENEQTNGTKRAADGGATVDPDDSFPAKRVRTGFEVPASVHRIEEPRCENERMSLSLKSALKENPTAATMAAPVPAPEKHHTQCTVSPVPAAAGASDKNETSDDDVVFVDEVVREVIDLT